MKMNDFYTTSQLSEKLSCNKKVIERKIRAGELRGFKQLGRWFVFHSDLVKWIKGNE